MRRGVGVEEAGFGEAHYRVRYALCLVAAGEVFCVVSSLSFVRLRLVVDGEQ